ncbi:MAG: hypothetical protein HYS98_07415 [Deltaproteobacteria bacterium]|nr:hypothetical protein [Deltaproteobacteria bacterium]
MRGIVAATLCGSLFIVGCATYPLRFKPQPGEKSLMQAEFSVKTETYQNNRLIQLDEDFVSFGIQSSIKNIEPTGAILISKKTVNKKGKLPLRNLGFPEKGEEMFFTVDSRGLVLSVKGEQPGSLFYLPFFIFPKKELVSLGATWEEEIQWNSQFQLLAMITTISSKLSAMEPCQNQAGFSCYRIEFKTTSHPTPLAEEVHLSDSSTGYYLWDPKNNKVTYAETHFIDTLALDDRNQSISRSIFKLKASSDQK